MNQIPIRSLGTMAVSMILLSALLTDVQAADPATENTSEKEVADLGRVSGFTLKDYRGTSHSLDDFKEKKFVVCAFLGTECPLAKLYGPRLAQFAETYQQRDVAFVAVNANQQDSLTKIAAYARQHGIKFPILKDLGNQLADQLQVTRTPEVVVWDQKLAIRYRGRIDDQFGVGYTRNEATRHDLRDALDELLSGKPVTTQVTEPVGCLIGRVRQPDPHSSVTYSRQVARIFQERCVECHREGEIAPFTLTSYADAVGWAEMIAEVVNEDRMPPWHADSSHGDFANNRRLTAADKSQILEWVRRGAPEGDPRELPKPREFIVGSQLPQKADLEVLMRDTPFVVKAEGEIAYQNFVVDPGFKEDKWITMAEALPGNRSVVHHIVVFVKPPESSESKAFAPGLEFLTTYVPGYLARPMPAGMAKWVPAGSRFVFQMHYTPIGTEQTDVSKLRLVFTQAEKVEHLVLSSAVQIEKDKLVIPANAENHRSEATGKVGGDNWRLLSLFPHMHLRGKSFRIDAKYPDGKVETLLNVPKYDFNWQTTYDLKNPKPIPKGTEMIIVGHHDNSAGNFANPDPSKTVHWGDQTWEEMLIALYEWTIPVPKTLIENR
jgi:peroxiredoxin